MKLCFEKNIYNPKVLSSKMVFILLLAGHLAPIAGLLLTDVNSGDDRVRVTQKSRIISELPPTKNPALLDIHKYGLVPTDVLTIYKNPDISQIITPPGVNSLLMKEVINRGIVNGTRYPIVSKYLITEYDNTNKPKECKDQSGDKCGDGYAQVTAVEVPQNSGNQKDQGCSSNQDSSSNNRKRRHASDSTDSSTSTDSDETNRKRSRAVGSKLIGEAEAAEPAEEILFQ